MQVTSNGRVRRTAAEWREVFSRYEESGLDPQAFCERESIQWTSFKRWQRKLNPASVESDFVPVKTASPAPSSWMVEITLPNSINLRFEG
jgi:hypothetical protein